MASSDESKDSEVNHLVQANNHLAYSLYKSLCREEKNMFLSPFSLSSALGMLLCGARNETYSEMKKALGYEVAELEWEQASRCFKKILSALEKQGDAYRLEVANALLSQENFSIEGDFKTLLAECFKAMLFEVDFVHESAKAVEQINDWVKDKTHGLIDKLLESLEPATVVVLLNAVYFKGTWLHQFEEKATFMQYFYNQGVVDNAVLVEMMHLKESFPFTERELFRALQLPYKGEEMAMMILLPVDIDGLGQIEKHLSSNLILELQNEMEKTKVEVALPKFRLEYYRSLKNKFQSLGMEKAFKCGANFGGMSGAKNLEVSDIVHKCVLEVNEEGSVAAAATAVVMMCRAMSVDPEFIVNHPFAFVIYNVTNGMIYFMGRVEELEGTGD